MIFSALSGFYYFYFSFIGVMIIFFPKVLSEIGYSDIELSIIMAAAPFVRFISPFVFGNRINLTANVFIASLLLVFLSALLMYMVIDSFYALLIISVLLGFGISLTLPYVELLALKHIKKESYGKSRLFGSLGFIVVALVLKEFMQDPYNSLHFYVGISFSMLLFGLLILKLVGADVDAPSEQECSGGIFKLRQHSSLWISLFLMQVAFMPFYNFFTIYETRLGISLDVTIYLWIVGVLFEIVMMYFQGGLFKRFTLIDMLIFTTAITVVRWLMIHFFGDTITVLYASQSLHAFSFALYHSVAIRLLFELYTQRKVAQQFFFGISYGGGAFVGSILAGFVYQFDPNIVFLYAAFITFLAFIFLLKEKLTNAPFYAHK